MAMNFFEYFNKTNNFFAHGLGNFRLAHYNFSESESNESVIRHTGRVSSKRKPNCVLSCKSLKSLYNGALNGKF
jgi:hypothetical protein